MTSPDKQVKPCTIMKSVGKLEILEVTVRGK